VLCFCHEVIAQLVKSKAARLVHNFDTSAGLLPVYEIKVSGQPVVVAHPGIGAPMAVLCLEKLIALGCRKFIVVGGAGILDREISLGRVFVPNAAVRDEGTSFHYLPPAREIQVNPAALRAIELTLIEAGPQYTVGKTWTTDAFFRETPARVASRKKEGCLTVEMEAAALFAVAQFRKIVLGQILYAGDVVDFGGWDPRNWQNASCRAYLLHLAAEACLKL
jgi:uridine phosphorylase